VFLAPEWQIEAGMRVFEFFRWAGTVYGGDPPDTLLRCPVAFDSWKRYIAERDSVDRKATP